MKSLLSIIIGLAVSWHYADIESSSSLASILAPLVFIILLISLLFWLVFFFQRKGISQTVSRGGSSTGEFGDFGDGGDC